MTRPDKKYTPPEPLVKELVATKTPRQLAIAYLRATRRARNAETAFNTYAELQNATDAARAGEDESVISVLRKAVKELRELMK